MADERLYNYNNDKLYKKLLKKTSQTNELNSIDDDFFRNIANTNYRNVKQQEIAKKAQSYIGQDPILPKKNSKYIYKGKMANKKKNKLPKALSLILAAAIAVGGISAITLGVKYLKNNARDNDLASSQQNLEDVTYRNTNSSELNTNLSQNNNLLILNSDLNNLIERYAQNPDSVSQEEVAQLLNAVYQEGRNIIFPKIANAHNNYSQENDEFPQIIDSDHLIYLNTKDVGWQVAFKEDLNSNSNGQAIAYNNDKLTNFIKNQESMKNLYELDVTTNTLKLKEDTTIDKAINSLISGFTDVNYIASSNIYFERGLLGEKILKIDEYQKDNIISNANTSNSQTINLSHNNIDLGDEER